MFLLKRAIDMYMKRTHATETSKRCPIHVSKRICVSIMAALGENTHIHKFGSFEFPYLIVNTFAKMIFLKSSYNCLKHRRPSMVASILNQNIKNIGHLKWQKHVNNNC